MFNIGDQVCLIANQNTKGVIINVLPAVDGMNRYQIYHDSQNINTYYENQIKAAVAHPIEKYYNIDEFIGLYAIKKLNLNAESSLYALNSSNIKFIPFQYRPLSKILCADIPRILIADEVGVGKTIETGIIIKEFEKRENINNIIIVCPKDLTQKWRREMKNRFDEAFEILSSDRFNYCINEVKMEGVWPYECRKCIIGLEMLRRDENILKLSEIADVIKFDMLVLDEAHHVINQGSNSHKVIEYLCENSEIAIFLSATPLQLGSRDLYSLLNLLNPIDFIEESIFKLMVEPNQFINSAIRNIRNAVDEQWQMKASNELKQVCVNEWAKNVFLNNSQLNYWISRLDKAGNISNEERIDCLKDLENLHTMSSIINRTKRKDIGEFTIREPVTIKTEYCDVEQLFYENVMKFKKSILLLRYNPVVINLIMSTIERQITSCIPAFVFLLNSFIERGFFSLTEITDDIDSEETDYKLNGSDLHEQAAALKELAKKLPEKDSKTEKLLEIIKETKEHSADGKLLVFSFFKHTLRYLLNKIQTIGIRVALITGDTGSDDRDVLRNRFRLPKDDDQAIDVLLCSEVGCEGLDYEFCSRMVNYDIPWNPMKIEQRIGRIDRYGQISPKVQIYNFITAGTIEERVFFRCYERLGIFTATIGDLEDILGNVATELTQAAFDMNLTDNQKLQKASQLADNAIRLVAEQRKFENDSKELFLMDVRQSDAAVTDEKITQIGLNQKLIQYYIKSDIAAASCIFVDSETLKLRLYKQDKQVLANQLAQLKRKRKVDKNSKQVQLFEKYLLSENQVINLSFNCLNENKSNDLFVTVTHPLMILALESIQKNSEVLMVSISVKSEYLPKGYYTFACYEWHEIGYRKSQDIKIIVYNIATNDNYTLNIINFEMMILNARDVQLSSDIKYSDQLNELIFKEQRRAKQKLSEINQDTVTRKLSTLDRYYLNLIEKTKNDLYNTTNEKIRIMRTSRINKLNITWNEKKSELNDKLIADITVKQFAGGFIEVKE